MYLRRRNPIRSSRVSPYNQKAARNGESGTALMELAIVAPTLMLIFFGILQWGIILAAQLGIQQATEIGVRSLLISQGVTASQNAAVASLPEVIVWNGDDSVTCVEATCEIPDSGGQQAHCCTATLNLELFMPFVVPGSSGGSFQLTSESYIR